MVAVTHGEGQPFRLDVTLVKDFITDIEDIPGFYDSYEAALLAAVHLSQKYTLGDAIHVVQWRAAVTDGGTRIALYD